MKQTKLLALTRDIIFNYDGKDLRVMIGEEDIEPNTLSLEDTKELVVWLQREVLQEFPTPFPRPSMVIEPDKAVVSGPDPLSGRRAVTGTNSPITASDQLVVEDLSHRLKGAQQIKIPK